MVSMGAKVYIEKSKERDCLSECDDTSLQPRSQAQANEFSSSSKDLESPTGDGEFKGKVADLCPITPRRENGGDSIFVSSTPLNLESPQIQSRGFINSTNNDSIVIGAVSSTLDNSPRTPEEGVFDPFAPGPDDLLFAPICKKLVKESRRIVARRLTFDDMEDFPEEREMKSAETLSEEILLDQVYGTLLEAIVRKQTEDFLAENYPLELQDLSTPTVPTHLTGIADTCPGAPMKDKGVFSKSRNIDPVLCKRLFSD